MANTKILATLGPATFDKLEEIIKAGADGFRINMSHVKELAQIDSLISSIRAKAPYAFIVADLAGPKIRLGNFNDNKPLAIQKDQTITIAPEKECPAGCIPIQIPIVYEHVQPGYRLLINDGATGLEVQDTNLKEKKIVTKVLWGNELASRKGVNIPKASIPIPFISEKDAIHIDFLVSHGVEYISASYTRKAADIEELKGRMGSSATQIIAKIENPEGLQNFDDILKYTDAVMVARGDMGMEIGPIYVPEHQKEMIMKCNRAGKIVITATQMLENMMECMEPKRAEISDIFNAVQDGTDIVMLSGETSTGKYPAEAVNVMNQTLERAEIFFKKHGRADEIARYVRAGLGSSPSDIISGAVQEVADIDGVNAIVIPTYSGYTARRISSFRRDQPIITLANDMMTARQLNAVWGVRAYHVPLDTKDLIEQSLKYVADNRLVPSGSKVLVAAGLNTQRDGPTNVLRVEKIAY